MRAFEDRDKIQPIPTMTVMMGCSRCGKSLLANLQKNYNEATIVSGDDVRRALGVEFDVRLEGFVSATVELMVRSLLVRGQDVIIDETNLTLKNRRRWYSIATELRAEIRVCAVETREFPEWKKSCEEDNFKWNIILGQLQRFQPVTRQELDDPRIREGEVYKLDRILRESGLT